MKRKQALAVTAELLEEIGFDRVLTDGKVDAKKVEREITEIRVLRRVWQAQKENKE